MGERVSLSELARRLQHNKGYIHKLKSRGVLEFDGAGMIDEEQAREAIARNRDPSKDYMGAVNEQQRERGRAAASFEGPDSEGASAAPSANATYMRARTMREALAAKTAQLDYRIRCGELVDARQLKQSLIEAIVIVRNALARIPDRLADRLAAERDAKRCYSLMNEEIELLLGDLETECDRAIAAREEVNRGRN